MVTKLEIHGSWSCLFSVAEARTHVLTALQEQKAIVDVEDGVVLASGGSAWKYRLAGSRSKAHQLLMPWLAEVNFLETGSGDTSVDAWFRANQGWFVYQGAPTRQRWDAFLRKLCASVVASTGTRGDASSEVYAVDRADQGRKA